MATFRLALFGLMGLIFTVSPSVFGDSGKVEKGRKKSVGGEKGELKLDGKTAVELIRSVEERLRGQSSIIVAKMEVIRPAWRRTLKMKVWSLGLDYEFVRILSPQRERGIASLRIKDQMWNYFPRADMVIKIPPSMMHSGWMGSDFTNDDIVQASSITRDYWAKIVRIVPGEPKVAVIELRPKPRAAVVWGKILVWVRGGDFQPLREEFYNERGEKVREMRYSNYRKMGNRVIPTQFELVPLKKKGYRTIFYILSAKFDVRVPRKIFSLRNLKKKSW